MRLFLVSLASATNLIFVLTDDQDLVLGGWTPMTKTQELVASNGLTVARHYVNTPVCCPSRAELLTGRFFHNLRTESGGCMHVDESLVDGKTWADALPGYSLAYFGKYLNQAPSTPPLVWDRWFANGGGKDVEPGGYLNASFGDYVGQTPVDGPYHSTPGDYTGNPLEYAGYTTSIIGNKSLEWLATATEPYALVFAPKAPHIPATPAPWHAELFSDLKAPRTESYNVSCPQHHWLLAQQGPISPEEEQEIDELFRDRWRTLVSVDDAIADLWRENTYMIITSDHGYQLGQRRLPSAKLNVYDNDLRVPLAVLGPGLRRGVVYDLFSAHVDLAPTLVGLLGGATFESDGRDLSLYLKQNSTPMLDPILIEYYSLGNVTRTGHLVDDTISNTYRALRFPAESQYGDFLYAEFTKLADWNFSGPFFYEAFQLDNNDPEQLNNIYSSLDNQTKADLAHMLFHMSTNP